MAQSNINKRVGARIRRLRRSRGLTQAELAERADLGGQTLSRVERGEQGASLESLERVAHALGEPLAALFEFDDGHRRDRNPIRDLVDRIPTDPALMRDRLERALALLVGEQDDGR